MGVRRLIFLMLISITCTDAVASVSVDKNMPLKEFLKLLEKQRAEELQIKKSERKLLMYYAERNGKR